MSSEITRIPVQHCRTGNVRYRYFSDDVRFTCKHIENIQKVADCYMDEDDIDYLYELCSFDISSDYLLPLDYNRLLEILNAMKVVLGTSIFNEVVMKAKAED